MDGRVELSAEIKAVAGSLDSRCCDFLPLAAPRASFPIKRSNSPDAIEIAKDARWLKSSFKRLPVLPDIGVKCRVQPDDDRWNLQLFIEFLAALQPPFPCFPFLVQELVHFSLRSLLAKLERFAALIAWIPGSKPSSRLVARKAQSSKRCDAWSPFTADDDAWAHRRADAIRHATSADRAHPIAMCSPEKQGFAPFAADGDRVYIVTVRKPADARELVALKAHGLLNY
jgi:hypothetical protein